MLEIGQKVKVTDQNPAAVGTIIGVSTWEKIIGRPAEAIPCYLIRCQKWAAPSWIAKGHLELIKEK